MTSTLHHATADENENGQRHHHDALRAGITLSALETVERFGNASAEFLVGYRGVDHQSGQTLSRSLKGIADYKVNTATAKAARDNIKQQAGFSAEIAATSRDNAEATIKGSKVRVARSDDLQQYGRNHPVVDRVQILDGKIIEGSQTQMKFVGNPEKLLQDIGRENGRFSRYRGIKLELPSEQCEGAKAFCQQQSENLLRQSEKAAQLGKTEVAAKLRAEAENFKQLAANIEDSGLTTDQAIFYREYPRIATLRDIARTSHRAGMEGAAFGAVIGGCTSILNNVFATAKGDMDAATAGANIAQDVGKAAALGYVTAAAGSALKAGMQQSQQQALRSMANTCVPTMAVNACISLSASIKRYVVGDIDETELLLEVGEKGAGMLASGMMAGLGQLAIPVPFVGAAIGGMVGYTLSAIFYQSALDAARGAAISRENLQRVRAIESAARARIAVEQTALDAFIRAEATDLLHQTQDLFSAIDRSENGNTDTLIVAINQYATLLGKQLQFNSQAQFDDFMMSDQALRL
ncbi:MAG: hypothetical protein ABW202_16905 [Duganella sp.]